MKKAHDFKYSDFEPIKNVALTFPGTEESMSYENTPSIKVRGKLMCRLHESGEFVAIHLDFDKRDEYLESYPEIFHLPDHYKLYPYICMWTHNYSNKLLKEILELCWRGLASKRQIKEWEKVTKK